VLFEDFSAHDLTFRLYYWMRLGGTRGGPGVDSDLRFAVADALAAAGIGMAFPQRDVHLDLAGPPPCQYDLLHLPLRNQ
jgi:small-conductance mechanosensitive channel